MTTHARSQYLETTFSLADMKPDSSSAHKDLSKAEIKRNQEYASKTADAICNFLNPFDAETDISKLYNISSGAAVLTDVESDLLNAEKLGSECRKAFVENRLIKGQYFFEPIKRMKLKTMMSAKKNIKLTTSQKKVIEYRHMGNIVTKLLVKSQGGEIGLDMTKLMTYCLTPVPYCIGIADGFLAKTNKANSFSFLTKDIMDVPVPTVNVLTFEDCNALFYNLKEIPDNFKQIAEKLYNSIIKSGDVLVSTDM